jgi:xanthine/CO dehydrogenase XdhC/CoxF family maturation factor
MKPSPELILNQAFAKIAMEMGPALPPGYGQGSATTTAVLLLMVAQEFNRAAAIRKAENDAMRLLFRETAGKVGGSLGERLKAAGDVEDSDITVAALDKSNASLKTLLIELQTVAEDRNDTALEARIIRMMQAWAAARLVFLPAM